MDIFLARQPIFDQKLNVIAYELLYRSDKRFDHSEFFDGNAATSKVINQSLMVSDFDSLVSHKMAFINFTGQLVLDEVPTLFDAKKMVVELLEDVEVTEDLVSTLKKLKLKGYTIALDDMVLNGPTEALVEYADIVKVDFMLTSKMDRLILTERLKQFPVKLLAEKVETMTEFREAIALGYHYFQGYFFAKPDLVKSKDVKPLSVSYLNLLKVLNQEKPDYNELALIVEADVSLSFKLLRLMNSAAFYRQEKITTIHQALVMLGLKELNKWVMLLMLQDVAIDQPDELMRTALLRGKMMEDMAKTLYPKEKGEAYFLVGLLSLIDVLMHRNLKEVLKELPLDEEILKALINKKGKMGDLLSLVVAYEESHWVQVKEKSAHLSFDQQTLPLVYLKAMEWMETHIKE